MTRRGVAVASVVAVLMGGLVAGSPADAAAGPKKFTGTITAPAAVVASTVGGGGDGTTAARRTCPGPGEFDGVFYKFFDLKGGFTKFKAYGPKPVIHQPFPGQLVPEWAINEYDIDVFLLDKKCALLADAGGGAVGAFETASAPARNPAHYAVITYFDGPYLNISVTLEAS